MSVGRLPADSYKAVGQTFSIIASVCIVTITVYHIYTINKNVASKCQRTVYTSMLLLFFAILEILSITLEVFDGFHTEAFCLYSKLVSVPSYLIFKCILYLILVNRTYSAFGDSPYAVWSRKTLKIWALILIIWTILNIAFNAATTETEFDSNGYPKCFTFVFRPFLMSMMALDIIACGINLYLFIKPVKTLSVEISKITEHGDGSEDSNILGLQHIAIKQCTLSVIAVITSVFTNIFIAMFSLVQLFVGLDVNVSTLCILLMYKWNDHLVRKICCLCVNDKKNKAINDKKNLEITANDDASSNDKKPVQSNTSNNTSGTDTSKTTATDGASYGTAHLQGTSTTINTVDSNTNTNNTSSVIQAQSQQLTTISDSP